MTKLLRGGTVVFTAALLLFGISQSAHAAANLLHSIKVGGGWLTAVSYINTQPPAGAPPTVRVHGTYQVKDPTNLTQACVHSDQQRLTTLHDLTLTVLDTPGGGPGTVFPASDVQGQPFPNPPALAVATTEGFMVVENYDGTAVGGGAGGIGADGTLTTEAILFNAASGFFFAIRGLTVDHNLTSPAGDVDIDAPLCGTCNYLPATPFSAGGATVFGNTTAGTLTRFAFLPPAVISTGAYVVAVNRVGTAELADGVNSVNLVAPGYNATIRLEAREDAAGAFAQGVFNRNEVATSTSQVNLVTCLAQLTPTQLVGSGLGAFIADGGWFNLSPRCWETEGGVGQLCDGDLIGTELGDAVIAYKTEFSAGIGFDWTPLHQQWYVK